MKKPVVMWAAWVDRAEFPDTDTLRISRLGAVNAALTLYGINNIPPIVRVTIRRAPKRKKARRKK